jgi:hypothetical protein
MLSVIGQGNRWSLVSQVRVHALLSTTQFWTVSSLHVGCRRQARHRPRRCKTAFDPAFGLLLLSHAGILLAHIGYMRWLVGAVSNRHANTNLVLEY